MKAAAMLEPTVGWFKLISRPKYDEVDKLSFAVGVS